MFARNKTTLSSPKVSTETRLLATVPKAQRQAQVDTTYTPCKDFSLSIPTLHPPQTPNKTTKRLTTTTAQQPKSQIPFRPNQNHPARSHQTPILATRMQIRHAQPDPSLLAAQQRREDKGLDHPLVPDLAVVRLAPDADFQLRVVGEVEGCL